MDALRQTSCVTVEDSSQVALARRTAHELATRLDFNSDCCGRIEIAAVELANNLHRYGRQGKLLINAFDDLKVLELLSVDRGPGMANPAECLRDGFTTGSTPGLGLGAVQRLSQRMEIYSTLGKGTVISALFAEQPPPPLPGVICVPYPGEKFCGDRWATRQSGSATLYMLVDGLGHGLFASQAAELAVDVFLNASSHSPTEIIEDMHRALHSTRGAAALVLAVDGSRRMISSCGVGNISASVNGTVRSQHIVSHNGTVGHQMRRIQSFDHRYEPGDLLILHSDGISTHWNLNDSPGLKSAAAPCIAGVLYRDATRGRDDATVLVTRLA